MNILKSKPVMVITVITGFIIFAACGKVNNKNKTAMPLKVPSNFPAPVYDLESNPITKQGFELGRKLFYDPILSRDGTVSCGSCHIQGSAFTHHGHDVSHGIEDRLGNRNSPAVMNLAWSKFFFWDGGVFNLDLQPIAPIENPVEMDEHIPDVISKLKSSSEYPWLFADAFEDNTVTTANMLKALSQFMLQCISANSRYDKYVRNEGGQLTTEELEGLSLFTQKCSSCHSTDLFTDNSFHNNGLIPSLRNDSGRYRITLNPGDLYLFKTPGLRNIAKTAPYMHDGRFLNLDAVLDHYSSEVHNSPTLDSLLITNGKPGISITADEKIKLKAFLNTLTDEDFLRNQDLSEQ